jgi:hypothetical protein
MMAPRFERPRRRSGYHFAEVDVDAAPGLAAQLTAARLAALVGVNQWLSVLTGPRPASLVPRRGCRLQSVIHDNSDRAEGRVKEVAV